MYKHLFDEFLLSINSLQVYDGLELIFVSNKDQLLPLMQYINDFSPYHQQVIIFDKIVGNAAALLAVRANCCEVYSPLGSEYAVRTLEKYGIVHYLSKIVPYITIANREDICPMEKLSLKKDPEEFYEVMRNTISM